MCNDDISVYFLLSIISYLVETSMLRKSQDLRANIVLLLFSTACTFSDVNIYSNRERIDRKGDVNRSIRVYLEKKILGNKKIYKLRKI